MDDLFDVPNWVQVMVGQRMIPRGHDPLADSIPEARALAAIAELRAGYAKMAALLPDHADAVGRGSRS